MRYIMYCAGHIIKALFNYCCRIIKLSNTLKFKINVLMIFIITIPLIFSGIYFYSSQSSMLTDIINKDLTNYVIQSSLDIESKLNQINYTSLQIFTNQTIKENLKFNPLKDTAYEKVMRKMRIEEQLNYTIYYNYAWESRLLNSIFIFKDLNNYYYLSYYSNPTVNQYNIKTFDLSEKMNMETPKLIQPSSEDQTIYFIRRIKDQFIKDLNGKIVLGINEKNLEDSYNKNMSHYSNTLVYLFNDNNIIFSTINKAMLGKAINSEFKKVKNILSPVELSVNDKTYFVASKSIKNYGLTLVIAIPKNEVMSKLSQNVYKYFYIILIAITTSLFLVLLLFSWIKRPIKDLMDNISNVKNCDFSVKMHTYKDADLNQLSILFNSMTDRIQYLFSQVYEKQLLLKEAEIKFLQSQINPHFLFNVLETISWHARMSNNETIYKMTSSLGQLLRANMTLNVKEKIVIKEELKYIEFYINLQKARFEDKLDVQFSIADQSILDFYLPKLCIQPIIENAIVHGLEKKRGKGHLSIHFERDSQNISFIIIDDGVGFDTENINFNDINSIEHRNKGHISIGLYNINQRIKLLYGNEYGVTIKSKIDSGTEVRVLIPIDRGDVDCTV